METIYAISSGATKSGVCVIRISGEDASKALNTLTKKPIPAHRMASVRYLYDDNNELLDDALVIYFEGPNSFTGEDVVELHIHGGRAVIDGILEALSKIDKFRLAEPGEFSRRAFENGKMDLTKAEAIADLIDAETKAQKKQALRQMEGELGKLYEGWRKELKEILAYTEATIDFADEEDVGNNETNILFKVVKVKDEISSHLNDKGRGEKLREGLSIAILGSPNAGKSQLLNAIAKRDVAIVSDTAGTTRDTIDVHLDLNGYPAIISDTAGIREATNDDIEIQGISRAIKKAENADLKIILIDASAELTPSPLAGEGWGEGYETTPHQNLDAILTPPQGGSDSMNPLDFVDENSIVVLNKCDKNKNLKTVKLVKEATNKIPFSSITPSPLAGEENRIEKCNGVAFSDFLVRAMPEGTKGEGYNIPMIEISALTGENINQLLDILEKETADRLFSSGTASITRERHRKFLLNALESLERAAEQESMVLQAEDIRMAVREIGKITGSVEIEELLDIIFSDFCIGK